MPRTGVPGLPAQVTPGRPPAMGNCPTRHGRRRRDPGRQAPRRRATPHPPTVTTDDPTPPRSSRPSGRPAPQPTGRPRGTTPGSGRHGLRPPLRRTHPRAARWRSPPSARSARSHRRRRTRGERVLRSLIGVVVVILVLVAAGYGYFRYQWAQVASAPCDTCVAAANGAPYNILLIGSDSRAGETAAQAQQFGSTTAGRRPAVGHPQDHPRRPPGRHRRHPVDPPGHLRDHHRAPRPTRSCRRRTRSTPRSPPGPDATVKTIENTFGIPISHYMVINFFGVEDAVNALGGISLDFPYPARDMDCSTGVCNNNSGLDHPDRRLPGAQRRPGAEPVAVAVLPVLRQRLLALGPHVGPRPDRAPEPGDLGGHGQGQVHLRPAALNSLLSSVVHDFSKDNGLSAGDLFALSERYHALSGSSVPAYVLPTEGAVSSYAGDVEVVQPDEASAMITQFLGGPLGTITTPPINQYGNPLTLTHTGHHHDGARGHHDDSGIHQADDAGRLAADPPRTTTRHPADPELRLARRAPPGPWHGPGCKRQTAGSGPSGPHRPVAGDQGGQHQRNPRPAPAARSQVTARCPAGCRRGTRGPLGPWPPTTVRSPR